MNTPAHLLLGAAAFARPGTTKVLIAALFGALAPDLSLYLMAGTALFLLQIPPQIVFNELYFSDAWQTVFAIDNSFFVWGALTGAARLHLAVDMPLHHDDARPHFWPLTSWVFESPYSYLDRAHGAMWSAPIEAVLAVVATAWLWWRGVPIWARGTALVLLGMEMWGVRQWLFFFVDS